METRFRGIEENDVLIFLDTKSKVVQVFAYLFIQIFGSERSLRGADVVGGWVCGSVGLSVPIMLYSSFKES